MSTAKKWLPTIIAAFGVLVSGCSEPPRPIDTILIGACAGQRPDLEEIRRIATALALTPFSPDEIAAEKRRHSEKSIARSKGDNESRNINKWTKFDAWWIDERKTQAMRYSEGIQFDNAQQALSGASAMQSATCFVQGEFAKDDVMLVLRGMFGDGANIRGGIEEENERFNLTREGKKTTSQRLFWTTMAVGNWAGETKDSMGTGIEIDGRPITKDEFSEIEAFLSDEVQMNIGAVRIGPN